MKKNTVIFIVLMLPTVFISTFISIIISEWIGIHSIPNFIDEELEYSVFNEFVVLLFYLTIVSIGIILSLFIIKPESKKNIKGNWFLVYYISVIIVLLFTFFNPLNMFSWFMG